MDCQGNRRTIGNQEEETRLSALHTRSRYALEQEPGALVKEVEELRSHPSLRPEAKELKGGRASKWYIFVRQLGDRYYVGRTIRHPSLDIVLPAVLIDCLDGGGYVESGKLLKTTYAKYKKRYGARCSYQRGFLLRTKKDPYTAPPLPEYSYDPAIVRQV